MQRPIFPVTLIFLVLGAFAVGGAGDRAVKRRPASSPRYTRDGELVRPDDYRTWVFVGAELGIEYATQAPARRPRKEAEHPYRTVGDFHNVYLNPEAYEHYVRTGAFPDQTILVMDVYAARQKEPRHIVKQGHYEAEQLRVEVAVKDPKRPDGSRTAWAYYSFPADRSGSLAPAARAHGDAECYACHRQHADVDNVWVQFYPSLRLTRPKP